MTQTPQGPIFEVRPQPNVYTVLLLATVIVLAIAIGVVFWKLMSPLPVGYGMDFGDLFKPLQVPT